MCNKTPIKLKVFGLELKTEIHGRVNINHVILIISISLIFVLALIAILKMLVFPVIAISRTGWILQKIGACLVVGGVPSQGFNMQNYPSLNSRK